MKIAITSGKGGVGKTFVAACLADVFGKKQPVTYIDCDVEAPNAHLFLKPEQMRSENQLLECVEGIDPNKCNYCGQCSKVCYFNAIVVGKQNAMVFSELCRWCGACLAACPQDALITGKRTIGTMYQAATGNIDLYWATLQAGAGGMTVRLIDTIKQKAEDKFAIFDSPPGTSCAVVHTINDADIVVLVGDPTRFGQHDLKLSVHMCKAMNIEPFVIINRSGIGDKEQLLNWCKSKGVTVLAEIPDDRKIAELYSKGTLPVKELKYLDELFVDIANKINEIAKSNTNPAGTKDIRPADKNIFLDTDNTFDANIIDHAPTTLNEVTVVSGKGGTGKTSLSACFAQLNKKAISDCDVDAADMHLLLEPNILQSDNYIGGRVMSINLDKCIRCGQCIGLCQWNAISRKDSGVIIEEDKCEGCGTCKQVCPVGAIDTNQTTDGRWYWSSTRFGEMSHATLEPGKENSGKLVTLLRKNTASKINTDSHSDTAIVVLDGSPGTGCPVIASVGGVTFAVIVTEPTVSGLHDLKRILELTKHFKIPSGAVINKHDINPEMTNQIKEYLVSQNSVVLGELPYNEIFIDAQQHGQTVLEYKPKCNISKTIEQIWNRITEQL